MRVCVGGNGEWVRIPISDSIQFSKSQGHVTKTVCDVLVIRRQQLILLARRIGGNKKRNELTKERVEVRNKKTERIHKSRSKRRN